MKKTRRGKKAAKAKKVPVPQQVCDMEAIKAPKSIPWEEHQAWTESLKTYWKNAYIQEGKELAAKEIHSQTNQKKIQIMESLAQVCNSNSQLVNAIAQIADNIGGLR